MSYLSPDVTSHNFEAVCCQVLMLVKHTKAVARQWVLEQARHLPGFAGAFYHGSVRWLPDDTTLPATSDVDVMVVLTDPSPPVKLGKFRYRDVLLEVSYLPQDHLQSADLILSQSHLAGSLRTPSIIADPSGQLTALQAAVAKDYAKRQWVYQRCDHARNKILNNLQALHESDPFPMAANPDIADEPDTTQAAGRQAAR